eukprot:gene34046-37476_t
MRLSHGVERLCVKLRFDDGRGAWGAGAAAAAPRAPPPAPAPGPAEGRREGSPSAEWEMVEHSATASPATVTAPTTVPSCAGSSEPGAASKAWNAQSAATFTVSSTGSTASAAADPFAAPAPAADPFAATAVAGDPFVAHADPFAPPAPAAPTDPFA